MANINSETDILHMYTIDVYIQIGSFAKAQQVAGQDVRHSTQP